MSPSPSPLPVIQLSGTGSERAQAFARAALPVREALRAAMEERLAPLRPHLAHFAAELARTEALLGRHRPQLLETLHVLARELHLDFGDVRAYALASYPEDGLLLAARGEGCTTWALRRPGGGVFLAKNRDYRLKHLPLQAVARVTPAGGQSYLTVTSLGSPGVFSSGMNAAGLAVADSRVRSADRGPGLPVYALAEALLERCATVGEALETLRELPRLGGSNLVLADARGSLALVELGHRRLGVEIPPGPYLVNTNHHVTPGLRAATLGPLEERRASQRRRRRLGEWLRRHLDGLDERAALRLMAGHRGGEPFCRHRAGARGATISTALYRPDAGRLTVTAGAPCRAEPVRLRVGSGSPAVTHGRGAVS